jgi:hypothetical protein
MSESAVEADVIAVKAAPARMGAVGDVIVPVIEVPADNPILVPAVPVTELGVALVIVVLANTPYVEAVARVSGVSTALAILGKTAMLKAITDPSVRIFFIFLRF